MHDIVIERSYFPGGTNGTLSYRGEEICKTIELPWLDNQQDISCIPEGNYTPMIRDSIKLGTHLSINGVPGRRNILLHPANNALKELKGCIAPVMEISGEGTGLDSKMAMGKLMNVLYKDLKQMKPVNLIIKSKYPGHEKEYNDLSGTANKWHTGE